MARRQWTFEAIGTPWRLQVDGAITPRKWQELQRAIKDRIKQFDKDYSRFRGDSWVTTIAAGPGRYQMPADALSLVQFYEGLYEATGGLVTPLIGQMMADAGYDAYYSFEPKKMTAPPAWHDALSYSDTHITLQQPALLDFGAAGKGYLVDVVSDLIEMADARNYTIDASGDILHRNTTDTPLIVGLENPDNTQEAIGTVELGNKSLCASAGSRRKWGGYHHIIDPNTLQSPTDVIATWVIASDTMTADGLATALFFVGPQILAKRYEFSYAVLHNDMGLEYAADFPAEIFEEGV